LSFFERRKMALLSLILFAAWTLLLIRFACVRATLSDRSFFIYLLQGAFIGTVGMRMIQRLFDPYATFALSPWIALLVTLAWQLSLLAPVRLLLTNRVSRVTSVADAFLLAFAIGFGFDLCGALLATGSASQPLTGLSFFPPWQYSTPTATFAGYGYWTALPALARSATLRFVRKRWAARVIWGAVLLWVAMDAAATTKMAESAPDQGLIHYIGLVTFHGNFTAWIAWIALISLSVWEARWIVKATPASAPARYQTLGEVRALLSALLRARFRQYNQLSSEFRHRRQVAIAKAELSLAPSDSSIVKTVSDLERLRPLEADPGAASSAQQAGAKASLAMRYLGGSYTWGLLVFLLFLLPLLPAKVAQNVGGFAWSALTLPFPIISVSVPIVSVFLLVVLLRRYVLSAGKMTVGEDMDDLMQFRSEQTLLKMCLGMSILILLYDQLPSLYPIPNLVVAFQGGRLPDFNPQQWTTLLLLFAAGISGLTLRRSKRWQRVPIEERRTAVLRQLSSAAMALAIAWACLQIYAPGVALLHKEEGVWLKAKLNDNGPNTAYAIAIQMMVLTGIVGASLTKLLSMWSRRTEAFFIGEASHTTIGARNASR
jgi:hypothetical protein